MNLKKIVYSAFVGLGLAAASFGMVNAAPSNGGTDTAVNSGKFGINEGNSGGVSVIGSGENTNDGIVTVIRNFINWIMGLLSLIAFCMLLFGGFQMVTAGGDEEGYKKGFVYLKNAGIGLGFIALSWMIVTLIFFVIEKVAT